MDGQNLPHVRSVNTIRPVNRMLESFIEIKLKGESIILLV